MELPQKVTGAEFQSPKRMVLYSLPKMGKTTALAALKGCLIVDLEEGSHFVEALKIKANNITELGELIIALKKAKEENDGKNPYKFIALDTATELEDIVLELAAKKYRALPMGKNWQGDGNGNYNVKTLPNGAGYLYLREAFQQVVDEFDKLCDHLILVGHVKDSLLEKKGKEVNSRDLDLTGQLKRIVCQKADAVAYMHRTKEGVFLNFKSSDELNCGSRCDHLKGKDILLGKISDDGNSHAFDWNKIYID